MTRCVLPKVMRTIAVTNQKGGCGKTTTSVNLAASFAKLGYRTLLVDFDPQSHATLGLGFDPNGFDRTIYDVLTSPTTELATSTIHCNINLAEAPGVGKPVFEHAPESVGAKEYLALAEEAIRRIGMINAGDTRTRA